MKRIRPKRTDSKETPSADAHAAARASSGEHGRPNFWHELYWFVVICLGGWILALAVLPPAMVRLRNALEFEAECRQRVETLTVRNAALKRVVNAFETDPHYREEVIRKILGVKKTDEVFLK